MSSPIDDGQLLELPIFSGLSSNEIAGLSSHTQLENHYRDDYVFRRGAAGDCLYVVLSGQIALELDGHEERRLLALSGPGDWFGELALLAPGPRSADARVTVDAKLLRISREGWTALNEQAPRLFARLCARTCERRTSLLVPRDGRSSPAASRAKQIRSGLHVCFGACVGSFPIAKSTSSLLTGPR
jgi:CRP-like cAMP-binding protein